MALSERLRERAVNNKIERDLPALLLEAADELDNLCNVLRAARARLYQPYEWSEVKRTTEAINNALGEQWEYEPITDDDE